MDLGEALAQLREAGAPPRWARRMTFSAFRYAVLAGTLAGSVSLLTREFLFRV